MPVIYEVSLLVDRAVADEFRDWLDLHVAEMLALPGFLGAERFELLEPLEAAAEVGWCVHYRLRDAQSLTDYIGLHAPRMRAAGLARFGGRFRASRRVLRPLDSVT